MRRPLIIVLGVLCALALPAGAAEAQQGAHDHIVQVLDPSAMDLEAVGFLTKAFGDAGVANEHAGFAAGGVEKPGDLASMKTHAGHVLHALDPAMIEDGPGFGFGVIPSARQAVAHVEMAAASADASANVRTHAEHVATSLRNTLERAERMVEIAERIRAADSASEADALADELESLSRELRKGRDADGDGSVTWRAGEGGLYQAQDHMRLLVDGEGLGRGGP